MKSRLRTLIRHWAAGLTTGLNAHLGAAIVVFSAERVAHFVGHVVAVIVIRFVR